MPFPARRFSMTAPVFKTVAIVGTGPTGLYTLKHLLQSPDPLIITLFEAGPLAGVGLPYSPDAAQVTMLANIASIELPPLSQTYLDWLRQQPEPFLQVYGVSHDGLHDRQFLPRLLLGAWFRDELERMIEDAAEHGHRVALREGARVIDVAPAAPDIRVSFTVSDQTESLLFSHVVLATGHVWPEDPEHDPGHFVSPWSGLIEAQVQAGPVGILGTSLSAIDAAMAVACQHGVFLDDDQRFERNDTASDLKLTLMSRQGLLPEADFWCPLPYRPLQHFTPHALEAELDQGPDGLLDRVWYLFVTELAQADPAYADAIGLDGLSPEGFAEAYFKPRLATDPFEWAAANLAQVDRNTAARRTVEWRYAILRMHEPIETIVAALSPQDQVRFADLKRVFIDNYAAVPPRSIRRVLALHRAGCLEIVALGADYELTRNDLVTTVVAEGGLTRQFDAFIDARGQKPLNAEDLPFPTLRAAMGEGPVPVTDTFAIAKGVPGGRIFLPAAPYLLARLPFVQGITASADMAEAVAGAILSPDPRDEGVNRQAEEAVAGDQLTSAR